MCIPCSGAQETLILSVLLGNAWKTTIGQMIIEPLGQCGAILGWGKTSGSVLNLSRTWHKKVIPN